MGAAFDRFCTPVQLERRKGLSGKVERLSLDLPFGRLVGLSAGAADAPPVLFVHGWNAQAEFFLPMVQFCVRQGLRVYAFDMPAHGLTREANPKPTSTLVEWVETLIHATQALGVAEWKCVIAHSFGSLATAFALGPRPWPGAAPAMKARALAFVAGAAGMPSVIDSYERVDGTSKPDIADIIEGVEAATASPLAELTIQAVRDALPKRILTVFDPDDRIAPPAALAATLTASEELVRPGAGHDGILFQLDVGRAVSKFAAA